MAWPEEQSVPRHGQKRRACFSTTRSVGPVTGAPQDEVRICAGRASMNAMDFAIGPCHLASAPLQKSLFFASFHDTQPSMFLSCEY